MDFSGTILDSMSGFGNLNILGPGVYDAASIGTVLEAFFYGIHTLSVI